MELLNDIYTVKSFIAIGDSLKTCFNCDYCRANDDKEYHFRTIPNSINSLFSNLPIAVNLFYGDPLLQLDNTLSLLRQLEASKHKGIVMLVTKGKLPQIPKMDIDLHIGITFAPDKISQENFEYNLSEAFQSWYKFSIEYRPICNGINDSDEMIDYVMSMAQRYKTSVAYSGLQLPPKPLNEKYKPYDNHQFSGQKYLSKEIHDKIQHYAEKYNVPIFRKTSCLLSYMHNFKYDYNAHFLKPLGCNCKNCILFERCQNFEPNIIELPFKYEIIKKDNYTCSFVKNGLCKTPYKECLNMSGYFIKPQIDELTRGDVRIIKWLTGCMVEDFECLIETPFISEWWK